MKAERIQRLLDPGLIAIIRAPSADIVPALCTALVEGGITALEITTSTPDTFRAIRETRAQLGRRALVGVGTVLDVETCLGALEAGAEFVVSPVAHRDLMPPCRVAKVPVMLGAFTPTECLAVHESGADFVKLFPADPVGPGYIRALRGPLPQLKIIPTGGIDRHNVASFFAVGCPAVGLGSSLVRSDLMAAGDWPRLTRLAREFLAAAHRPAP